MNFFRKDLQHKKPVLVDVPHKKVMMCLNESTLNPFKEIEKEVIHRFQNLPINRYFNSVTEELENLLSNYVGVPKEYLFYGNGADEMLFSVFLAVRENPQSFCVSLSPSYFDYKSYSGAVGLQIKFFSLQNNFDFGEDEYLKLCEDKNCKLAILCQPNNPTGNSFDEEKIEKIIRSLKCPVIVDETYFEFSNLSLVNQIEKYPNLILIRSFSKGFSAAGLRFGYAISQPENIESLKKVTTVFHMNLLTQSIVCEMLKKKDLFLQHNQNVIQMKNDLYRDLKQIKGITVHPSKTNFLIFSFGNKTLNLFDYLSTNEIAVRNIGAHPILKDFLRVTIGTKQENDKFLELVKLFCRR